ncbi:DUF1549 and DUF1553 domain-containing protein [soil metagenome]
MADLRPIATTALPAFAFALAALAALPPGSAQAEKPITDADRDHWSFLPPVRPALPDVAGPAEGALDRFILAKLEEAGLGFAPEAAPHTLIRRLTFDLTGRPPEPEDVHAFVSDPTVAAYARAVDHLLESPEYGERWAQHWLDLAGFAESDGFEHDKVRPDAWRYRDWLIAALNADVPYGRFLQLQLAADEIAPGDEAAQAATGFLLAGPDMPDINLVEERRHSFLNGMTSTVGEALLGLTLGCAQCHDHKTDPVSIDDFYRMRAVFANTVVDPARDKPLGHLVREPGRDAPPSFVMLRGDFGSPGPEVEPAFLRVVNLDGHSIPRPGDEAGSSMRRAAFARWITRPDHPLTSRVLVNRLWQHHFGIGLVPSSGDFGHTGEPPSHPELLDWLATELPDRGWSLKAMHRLMVTSRTYRQASHGSGQPWQAALKADPANRLLSRMPRRRLEGEAIRDSFLSVSGLLNRDGGGPSVRPPLPKEVTSTLLHNQWEVTEDADGHRRRSIYLFVRRNLRYPIFDVFDRPDSHTSCSRRSTSTTAPQSLMLLNSEFSLTTATALAGRVAAASDHAPDQVARAYALLFSRPPDPHERDLGRQFLEHATLREFCLALLNTNEAIYVD